VANPEQCGKYRNASEGQRPETGGQSGPESISTKRKHLKLRPLRTTPAEYEAHY
jgi:hypothetical protein